MKVRYARFKGIKFGVIPEDQQGRYLRDLLPFEQGLWYGQEEIGRVGFATFKLDVHDPKPFCHKPISYPPKARAWLNDHLRGLERMGIVRRVNMLRDCMTTVCVLTCLTSTDVPGVQSIHCKIPLTS
jgi:hypothetical protein